MLKYIEMNAARKKRLEDGMEETEREALDQEDSMMFDDLKRIMKELLFNGARRDIQGNFELSSSGPVDGESVKTSVVERGVTPF